MKKRFAHFNVKKLIFLLLGIFILAILVCAAVILRNIDHSKVEDSEEVIQLVKDETPVEKVTSLDYFADEETYDIIYGKDSKDNKYLIFNPSGNRKKDNLTVLNLKDVLSKEKIEKNWQSNCERCKLKRSSPAMLEDKALWELAYLDEKERYVMEYISLKDGSTFEQLRLNKKYR